MIIWWAHVIILFYEFYFQYKSKPQGSSHSKLHFTHLIWLAITTTPTEAQIRDNPHYSGRPELAFIKRRCATGFSPSPPRNSLRGLYSSSLLTPCFTLRPSSSILLLIFLLQHYDLNSCTIENGLSDLHPSYHTKACIATLLIILVRNKTKKKR